jgi:hypothetical protein
MRQFFATRVQALVRKELIMARHQRQQLLVRVLYNFVDLPTLCLAIYPKAHAADSLTPGSNSSKHPTKAFSAPESTTA